MLGGAFGIVVSRGISSLGVNLYMIAEIAMQNGFKRKQSMIKFRHGS